MGSGHPAQNVGSPAGRGPRAFPVTPAASACARWVDEQYLDEGAVPLPFGAYLARDGGRVPTGSSSSLNSVRTVST